MKKIFLLFTLFCLSNLLFGQAQKGTHFFGTSHISEYASGRTNFFEKGILRERSFSFQYGIFIKDNVLVGASLSYTPDMIFFIVASDNSLSLNPFYRRYFGQKKIKPFVEAAVGVKLFSGDLYANAEIRPGIALFLNSNTSLDLSFNFPLFNTSGPRRNRFFPQGITPSIGLGLRFFLKYDRDTEPNITAKEMIKKGIFSVGFSSYGLSKFRNTSILSEFGLEYFFLKNIYVNGGLNISLNRNNVTNRLVNQFSLNPKLGLGGYFPLGDYTALAIHANGQQRLINKKEEYSTKKEVYFLEAQAQAGLALFLGRQKLEILSGVEFVQYESDVAEVSSQSDRSFIFTIDYEYFVSDKLSINTSISAFPKSQRQSFLSGALRSRAVYEERYDLNMNVRLKWYINTKSLKKKEIEES